MEKTSLNKFIGGLRQPTVIDQIKRILSQYPDDGQILKELIQNAEDAGASTIKFLYDRNHYPSDNLLTPSLAQFQGEALYAYNDAVFTSEDWDGIGRVCSSVKEKNPMKVGRFGLGFKSVFHITDIPSVLSGNCVAFIDPNEKHLPNGTSTDGLDLDRDRDIVNQHVNQITPFLKDQFGCGIADIKNSFFKGTVFRLPLRTTESELSKTVYDADRIFNLFKIFIEDGHLNLLFLNHLENVEILYQPESGQPKRLFRVRLSEDCLPEIRAKRKSYLTHVRSSETSHMTFKMKIETDDCRQRFSTSTWLVTHHFNKGNPTSSIHRLCNEESLGYLPWVAIAMPINNKPPIDIIEEPDGHLFCFLPLPHEKVSLTGFPFHVHGYFAVEENRRHLKWPTTEQDVNNLSDKALLWNVSLMLELLPEVISELLRTAREDGSLTPQDVYAMIPNPEKVHRNWQFLRQHLFVSIFEHALLHSELSCWVNLEDAVLCTEEQTVLAKVLAKSGTYAVITPSHIRNAVANFTKYKQITVSQQLISASYREVQYQLSLSRDERLYILRFLLERGEGHHLHGLLLLPLAVDNSVFCEFLPNPHRCHGSKDYVYIPTERRHIGLFPRLGRYLLSQDLPIDVRKQLQGIAAKQTTNLRNLERVDAAKLIRELVPANELDYLPPGHPSFPVNDWLQSVWTYLQDEFSEDISPFCDVHLIPAQNGNMYRLQGSVSLIENLQDKVLNAALSHLGIVTVELPNYIKFHRECYVYVDEKTPVGVLKALKKMHDTQTNMNIDLFSTKTSDDTKRCLLNFLSQGIGSFGTYGNVLKHLPIFETLDSKFVDLMNAPFCRPSVYTLPVPCPGNLLKDDKHQSRLVLEALGITAISIGMLLKDRILPNASDRYSKNVFKELILHILNHLHEYKNDCDGLCATLSTMQIVHSNKTEQMLRASDFIDPLDRKLVKLFTGIDVFPAAEYSSDIIVSNLKTLGLKCKSQVTASDLSKVVRNLSVEGNLDHAKCEYVAESLQCFLEDNRAVLRQTIQHGLFFDTFLQREEWVPIAIDKPSNYPDNVSWYDGKRFEKPKNVYKMSEASLIGSVKPITKIDLCFLPIRPCVPSLHSVVEHFANVIQGCMKDSDKPRDYTDIVTRIYNFLMNHDVSEIKQTLKKHQLTNWVWQNEGFSSIRHVIEKPFMDLRPYIYTLPREMHKYIEMLRHCGMKYRCDELLLMSEIQDKYHSAEVSDTTEVRHDLGLYIHALRELENKGTEDLQEDIYECIYFPVSENFNKPYQTLKFAKIQECAYANPDGKIHSAGDVLLVHPHVPISTAKHFKVASSTSQVLGIEDMDMDFGQSEPLTRRLKSILSDYTDGLAVVKELIQNADDAGATEICFLYDERQNSDSKDTLIDPGMQQCQGPALWVHNNAVFTDDDFDNIGKLSGARKKDQIHKIGRFGLGFNAVYNLTDVPSFISKQSIVIFDPQTHHLGNAIKDKLKPGIRINMHDRFRELLKYKDQFKPYEGIFEFCMPTDNTEMKEYNGTLFRLPLRTKEQASTSEISQLHYSPAEVKSLLKMIVSGADDLLLFCQNVLQLKLYMLPQGAKTPIGNMIKLFSVEKQLVKMCRQMPFKITLPQAARRLPKETQGFITQSSILKVSSALAKANQKNKSVSVSMIIQMKCTLTDKGKSFLQNRPIQGIHTWLQCLHSCSGHAFDAARNDETLVPVVGVAGILKHSNNGTFSPVEVDKGKLFCFMPLPILTNLPVHINGYFSVTPSRQHLTTATMDDKDKKAGRWNELLLTEGLYQPYMVFLEEMTSLGNPSKITPFPMWPFKSPASPILRNLWDSLYQHLSDVSSECKELFTDNQRWVRLPDCRFLDKEVKGSDIAEEVLDICKRFYQEAFFIDMPKKILQHFERAGCEENIAKLTWNMKQCLETIFFPNIVRIPFKQRNAILLFAMQNSQTKNLIENHCSIPVRNVATASQIFRKPCDLIHPKGYVAVLFDDKDARFPIKNFTALPFVSYLLEFGMQKDDLKWDDLIERSQSIKSIKQEHRKQRISKLIKIIDKKAAKDIHHNKQGIQERFSEIKFLFAKSKPKSYPMFWKGSQFPENELHDPGCLYTSDAQCLVGSSQLIFDDSTLNHTHTNAIDFLRIKTKTDVTVNAVLTQLLNIKKLSKGSLSNAVRKTLDDCLREIYCFIQERMKTEPMDELLDKVLVLQERRLIQPQQMCFCKDGTVSPYLWSLDSDLAEQFQCLFQRAGVKDEFTKVDYIRALHQMKDENLSDELSDIDIDKAVTLLNKATNCDDKDWDSNQLPVYIPDTHNRLKLSSFICYSNCPWFEDGNIARCNTRISYEVAKTFGVKTVRETDLEKHAIGIPFGQHESLTNRIKRILATYPSNKEILNELLQNADDAKASEIHFVIDRQNYGTEKVFEDSWKALQGPALSVYNNATFTSSDMEGIQKLGEGSKTSDPFKIGQYGIGFNCVYHITDVPCILTSINDVETLCVFDPNCRYMPGATELEPGRRLINLSNCRRTYQDVFSCFLEDHFDTEGGTLFRFPLRTKEMAEQSSISTNEVTAKDLLDLTETFIECAQSAILFLQHIEKITISEKDETGDLTEKYSLQVQISKEDDEMRREFMTQVGKMKAAHHDGFSILQIPMSDTLYRLTLESNRDSPQHWLISRQFGFSCPSPMPDNISKSFQDGSMRLLPQGEVAVVLEANGNSQTDFIAMPCNGKAFCFLPLPVETQLPVHVNGPFVLDHESRKDLWKDEGYSDEKMWNEYLLKNAIAPAYRKLLENLKDRLAEISNPNMKLSFSALNDKVKRFFEIFPKTKDTHGYWRTLACSVYEQFNSERCEILPIVIKDPFEGQSAITWVAPSEDMTGCVYFHDLKDIGKHDTLKTNLCITSRHIHSYSTSRTTKDKKDTSEEDVLLPVLLKTGLQLITAPDFIFESFIESEVQVLKLTPEYAISFYKTYGHDNSHCTIAKLPTAIQNTTFESLSNIKLVLNYCKDVLSTDIVGLPLLVTQNGILQIFDPSFPVFASYFVSFFPNSAADFLHRELLEYFRNQDSYIFKPLCLESLATMLQHELPHQYYCEPSSIWYPDNENIPNKNWLFQVWKCIHEILCDGSKDLEELDAKQQFEICQMKTLDRFCLIPAIQGSSNILSSLTQLVLVTSHKDKVYADIHEILVKLELPVANLHFLYKCFDSDIYQLVQRLTYSGSNPDKVLCALNEVDHSKLSLNKDQISKIMEYFNVHIGMVKKIDGAKNMICNLPFHLCLNGTFVSVTDVKCFWVPEEIPVDGIDEVQHCAHMVFMKEQSKLVELMKFVECNELSVIDFYCKYLFDSFANMSQEQRFKHMSFLRAKLKTWKRESQKDDVKLFFKKLQRLALIPEGSRLCTADSFYDAENHLFTLMEDHFLPEPFDSEDWRGFMRTAGLITKVSDTKYVEYAEAIAKEAKYHRSKVTCKKSRALIKQLFENDPSQSVLKRIKSIPFIEPPKIPKWLPKLQSKLGTQYGDNNDYIRFQMAVPHHYYDIVWTSAHVLPSWEDTDQCISPLQGDFEESLGIQRQPDVDLVAKHLQNVCNVLAPRKHVSIIQDEICSDLGYLVNSIYDFLHRNMSSSIRENLFGTCCIYIPDAKRLILPQLLVRDLNTNDEIPPYLHKIPLELGRYCNLFKHLGMQLSATLKQYALVLEMIAIDSSGKPLHPNGKVSAQKAVEGLFGLMYEMKDINKFVSKLFLPCYDEDNHLRLQITSSLTFFDEDQWSSRIKTNTYKRFANICSIDHFKMKQILTKLPDDLKVKMISDIVVERLEESCKRGQQNHSFSTHYDNRFSSEQICEYLILMIKQAYDAQFKNKNFDELEVNIGKFKQTFLNTRVVVLAKCLTYLLCEGKAIKDSTADVPFFVQKDERDYKVFVNGAMITDCEDMIHEEIKSTVQELILSITNVTVDIMQIFTWKMSNIRRILQRKGIPIEQMSFLPDCGAFIPLEEHHLLSSDFSDFFVGEFVGYEIEDPVLNNEDETPTYIYALIVAILHGPGTSMFSKEYRIKIDEEDNTKDVLCTDLYKFHRIEEVLEVALCMTQNDSDRQSHKEDETKTLSQIQDEISDMLEEAWKLPKQQRDKIIKRLYLKWHPDKNVGNEAFCTEVFKYLQNEINRLEEGRPRNKKASARNNPSASSYYEPFFDFMNTRARSHRRHYARYRSDFQQRSSSYFQGQSTRRHHRDVPPSFTDVNPQPGESRRWMAQAAADLQAAKEEKSWNNEWACLKLYQAAEKAITSCLYAVDANTCRNARQAGRNLYTLSEELNHAPLTRIARDFHEDLGRHAAVGMSYPSSHCAPQTPHQFFTTDMSQRALRYAETILRLAGEYLSTL